MFPALLASAIVVALGPRPAALTHARPQAYAAWLHARVVTADRAFGGAACPDTQVRALLGRPLPLAERAQSGAGAASGPVFLERVRLDGCGRSVTHNIQVTPLRAGGWDGVGLVPGEPRSTPRQQNAAMQRVAAAALNGAPLPCSSSAALRSMANGEARVVAEGPSGWTEHWPLRLCGVDRTVTVRFDRSGHVEAVTPAWPR